MNKLAIIAKRYSYVATAALLTLAMAAPALISGSAGALQLENRSIQPSTATPGVAATYQLTFDLATAGDVHSIVIDFCDDATGPIEGTTCTLPSGMTRGTTLGTNAVTVEAGDETSSWTASTAGMPGTAVRLVRSAADTTTATGDTYQLTIGGFTNPSPAVENTGNTVYARVFVYATDTASSGYTSAAPGAFVDNGSAAFAIVPEIDVTAVVRETLTFCVGGSQDSTPTASSIDDNCTGNDNGAGDGSGEINTPSVKLGSDMDGVFVIDDSQVWTGNVFYQLTTNAFHGTSLKIAGASTDLSSGSNAIEGLAAADTIDSGEEGFGMQVVEPGAVAAPEDGTALTVTTANFPALGSTYAMPSGVESPYGLQFAAAGGAVRNANGTLQFGARSAPNTPAGIYTAGYSVIATPSY